MDRAKYNFRIGLTHEALWGFGFGFIQPITILPLALTDLGGSAALAGLLGGLFYAGINLPQAFSALSFSTAWTSPKRLALLHIPAVSSTFFIAAVFFFVPSDNLALKRALFLAGIAAFSLGVGLTVPHWMVGTSRCIPEKIRGRYFGVCFFLAGLLGTLTSHEAADWAAQGGLQWGYAASFLAAGILQTASVVALTFWKPLEKAPVTRTQALLPFLRKLLPQGEKAAWVLFLCLNLGFIFMNAAGSQYTVDLREARSLPKEAFTLLAPAFALGGMAGAFLIGYLTDHKGPRTALAGAMAAAAVSLGFIAFAPVDARQALSFFGSGYAGSAFIGNMLVILVLSGKTHPSTKVGILNTLLAPFSFGAPFLAGFLAERFGFGAAYAFSGAAVLIAALLLLPNPLWRAFSARKAA
jgi:MFS family permease